jgi:hypothetical protein
MHPPGYEPTVPENGRLQSHDLDRTATGIGIILDHVHNLQVQSRSASGSETHIKS